MKGKVSVAYREDRADVRWGESEGNRAKSGGS